MAIKDFIEKYKGEVLFIVTESNGAGELKEIISFDTKELSAIKENITSKEIYKWSVAFANNKATVTIIVKETTPTVTEPSTKIEGTIEQG